MVNGNVDDEGSEERYDDGHSDDDDDDDDDEHSSDKGGDGEDAGFAYVEHGDNTRRQCGDSGKCDVNAGIVMSMLVLVRCR